MYHLELADLAADSKNSYCARSRRLTSASDCCRLTRESRERTDGAGRTALYSGLDR